MKPELEVIRVLGYFSKVMDLDPFLKVLSCPFSVSRACD
jgi:hypothetical protein